MTPPRRQPDPGTRLVSHAIVGLAAGAITGRRSGLVGFLITAVIAAASHEALDAPVAQLLTDLDS